MSYKIMIQANTPEDLADQAQALANYFKNTKTQPVQAQKINNDIEPTVVTKETSTASAAPITPTPTPQTKQPEVQAPSGQDVDVNGLPWDERIHASSKNKNTNGTWRTKRGLDKAELERVEAEIRNGMQPTPPVPEPTRTPLPEVTYTQESSVPHQPINPPVQQPFSQAQPPVQQPMPQPTPLPAQDATYTLDTFRTSFIDVIANLQQQGKIDQGWINQVKGYLGIQELWQVTQNDAQLREMYKMFTDNGLIKGA